MDLIGAGLDYHVYRCATTTEFRAHRVLFCAEFLNSIGWRKNDDTAKAELVIVYPVQQEIVIRNAQSIHRERFIGPLVLENSA